MAQAIVMEPIFKVSCLKLPNLMFTKNNYPMQTESLQWTQLVRALNTKDQKFQLEVTTKKMRTIQLMQTEEIGMLRQLQSV
jgi:hypothetical protein